MRLLTKFTSKHPHNPLNDTAFWLDSRSQFVLLYIILKSNTYHGPPIGISLLFGSGGCVPKRLPDVLFWVWPAPKMNSWGVASDAGRAKMEEAPALPKAGTTTWSIGFGKPKLKDDGTPGVKVGMVGLLLSTEPKIFCSNSSSCW